MDTKKWWQSKTLWCNLIALAVGVLGVFVANPVVTPTTAAVITGLAVPILNVILRFITTTAIQ